MILITSLNSRGTLTPQAPCMRAKWREGQISPNFSGCPSWEKMEGLSSEHVVFVFTYNDH